MRRDRLLTDGYTLMELVIATALMGLLVLIVATVNYHSLRASYNQGLTATRDQLVLQIRQSAMASNSVITSLSKKDAGNALVNPELHDCICGVGACQSMQQPFKAVTLYDWSGQQIAPAFYDVNGIPCQGQDPGCTFKVSTTFFAECKPNLAAGSEDPAPNCPGASAEFVAINYKVEQNPNFVPSGNSIAPRPISGTVFVDPAQLDLSGGVCL
jgi:prepilin-type N-terminal cleavage/methylation domain-containing protein